MSRTMPTECPHGFIVDWGDFGGDDSEPERCEKCQSLTGTNQLRDMVFRFIVREAKADPNPRIKPEMSLRQAIETIGIFHLMEVVDLIVAALQTAYVEGTSLADIASDDEQAREARS